MNLNDLNKEQRKACEFINGPVLVLAGAGAGKTRVLTHKIVYMIEKGVDPRNIIALTFTNKAAKEMRERVNSFLSVSSFVWISTFHSACSKILRRHIDKIGYDLNFTIYDDNDSLTLIKQIMKSLKVSDKEIKPKTIKSWISDAKNSNVTPDKFVPEHYGYLGENALRVYRVYQESLKRNNAVDFGDIIMLVLELFEKCSDVLEYYQQKFQYVLVDEYQDTNKVQYLFLKKISLKHRNITVVGDEDQSIYGWRGADINNILSFNKHYKDVATIKLEENYRSTQTILSAANKVVKNNKNRLGKTIWTSNGKGEKITHFEGASDRKEADYVVNEIEKNRLNEGIPYSQMAIFYRTNAQSRLFEERLRRLNIPYRIFGGLKFYDRAEIKNVIAYFKVLVNSSDDVALKRVLGLTAGIGKTTIDALQEEASMKNISMYELIESGTISNLKMSGIKKLMNFYELVKSFKSYSDSNSISDLYDKIALKTEIVSSLKKQKTIESESKLENLNEFRSSLKEFEGTSEDTSLFSYLDQVSLLTSLDEDKEDFDTAEKLTLMTLHMSKGLEYDHVFLVGLEERLLPHARVEFEPSEVEEERRLMYVGMTRARKRLYLTNAKMRDVYGQSNYSIRSRFLDEIPSEFLREIEGEKPDLVFTNRAFKGFSKRVSSDTRIVYDNPHDVLRVGSRVSHKVFGVGKVKRVEGFGDNAKLTIEFKSGLKKLKGAYASLEVL